MVFRDQEGKDRSEKWVINCSGESVIAARFAPLLWWWRKWSCYNAAVDFPLFVHFLFRSEEGDTGLQENSPAWTFFPGHTYYENTLAMLDSDFLVFQKTPQHSYFPTWFSTVVLPSFPPFLVAEKTGNKGKGGEIRWRKPSLSVMTEPWWW